MAARGGGQIPIVDTPTGRAGGVPGARPQLRPQRIQG